MSAGASAMTGPPPAMPLTLIAWLSLVRWSLRGFVTILLGRSLRVTDISVFQSNGKTWASFPGKPLIGDGRALLDDRGKQRYAQILEWSDKPAADRFSGSVVAAIIAEHGPEALGL